jgi:precorrin-3B C17-methyltransferase
LDLLTNQALDALERAEIVFGFRTYLELAGGLLAGKQVVSYEMTEELIRARTAIAAARAGRQVALVSGGDPGVYGMAGLVLELAQGSGVTVNIIPGITAATAAASYLGAPLMHDFAVISLSDRLTPWELIAKRLDLACQADLVIAIYNPQSQNRPEGLARARQIILAHRKPQTPVGIVRKAFREGALVIITDVEQLLTHPVDMSTTLIIGNSQSVVREGKMITPRGYLL